MMTWVCKECGLVLTEKTVKKHPHKNYVPFELKKNE